MKKGFTLIELLAVIVILAIIAIIATPIIINIINETKESANMRSAEMYLKAATLSINNENLKNAFNPNRCEVLSENKEGYKIGDLYCDDETYISVEIDKSAQSGTIILSDGRILSVIGLRINDSIYDMYDSGNLELLKKYTVEFDTNGGESNISDQEVLRNRLATIPTQPTKEGYTFKGWQLNGQNYDFNTPVTQDIKLTAKWIKTYTLTTGCDINSRIKTLANGENKNCNFKDTTVKTISFYANGDLPDGYTLEKLEALSVNGTPKDLTSNNSGKIKAYWDGKGNIYVYSSGQIAMNDSTGASSSGHQVFNNFTEAISIDLSQVDTNSLKSAAYMFDECYALTNINLSGFKTENITNMSYMFNKCYNLKELDLSNFVTTNVTTMRQMFCKCSSLTTLDLSSFETPNLINIQQMFQQCSAVNKIDLRKAELSGATAIDYFLLDVPKSLPIYLKDTQTNIDFMSTNFSSYTNVQYITPPTE